MRRPLLFVLPCLLLFLAGATGCSSSVSGANPAPLPDLGNKDPNSTAEDCSNGADDDGDFAADCSDPDCMGLSACGGGLAEDCGNALDDDGDGWIDCDDHDCWSAARCAQSSEANCTDGQDDDSDGAKDCEDADCVGKPGCEGADPVEECTNGLDDDADVATDCDDSDCADNPVCASPEICDNGADDDGDEVADCEDADCVDAAACRSDPGPDPDPDPNPDPDPQPAVCGNGVMEAGEECDDHNTVAGDGCDDGCAIEIIDVDEGDDGTVQSVTSGQSVAAAIQPAGDDDWYSITLAAGARLTVETSDGAGGCGMDTVLQLFGATRPNPLPTSTNCTGETGDLLCDDDGGPGMCSLLDYTAETAGTFNVRVLEYGNDGTGDYHVTFTVVEPPALDTKDEWEPNGTPGVATSIIDGDLVEGEIGPDATDQDYFSFEVSAFETLRIETSDGQGGCNFDSILFLYDGLTEAATSTSCATDPDAFDCNDDDGIGNCSLIDHFFWDGGTYTARLISYGQRTTGSYFMTVSIQ